MLLKTWTRSVVLLFALVFLCTWAFQVEAWARAGGGGSMGSRGSRSMTAPKPYTQPRPSQPSSTYNPTRPATPPLGAPGASPSSSGGFLRSFGGGILGGLAGGMLFRGLFGGPSAYGGGGYGGGGGIGLFDILLLAGIAYLIYWYIKKKRQEAATGPSGYYQSSGSVELPPQPQYPPAYDQPQVMAPEGDRDLERGLTNIRQFDPSFDEARFQDMGMDTFFKIQGAWANRDMTTVKHLLTEEMFRILQEEADRLKAQKQINRLDNIAVRSVDITEAWQESGSDFITVRVYANLLDYTTDETGGQVVSGSKTEPVKFEEYWTFTRAVGNNAWQLSAINQAT